MSVIPIQVTDEGVLIPKVYLHDAREVEVIVQDDYVLVRPKPLAPEKVAGDTDNLPLEKRFDFIGIGHSRNPSASVEAEEILKREIKRESGWSLD